jgi:hypothetical protein
VDVVKKPGMRNYSMGMQGVLGSTGSYQTQTQSMPDLIQNKRQSKLNIKVF